MKRPHFCGAGMEVSCYATQKKKETDCLWEAAAGFL